ncbi:hypothetical protein IKX64_01895 [Candidatus Saccharibacteria bacterium]|nr:hypothetical protein [Candidatus Saccharibacteria bacterium]
MDGGLITFIVAIIIVGALIFVAILLTGKRNYHLNTEFYQSKFLAIESRLQKENPASYTLSIIEADKLLDKALMEVGLVGKTMGDRLKKSNDRFSDINAVWHAHKLRNAIAHDADFEIGFTQAKNALSTYKQALKDLGAI